MHTYINRWAYASGSSPPIPMEMAQPPQDEPPAKKLKEEPKEELTEELKEEVKEEATVAAVEPPTHGEAMSWSYIASPDQMGHNIVYAIGFNSLLHISMY